MSRYGRIDDLPPQLRQRWAAARVWAAHQAPYLASALLALNPVVVDQSDDPVRRHDLRRLPTDPAWHVYLDPEVLAAFEVPDIGFWLLHQVTHLLREHARRYPGVPGQTDDGPLPGRTPEHARWNAATDAEIDDDITAGAVVVPQTALTPAQLGLPDGQMAEQYWDALSKRNQPATDGTDSADCGSGCDGQQRGWDCDQPGLGRLTAQLVRRDTARRIQRRRERGTVPAGWQRWADEVFAPAVNWRRHLAAAVRSGVADVAGRVDFTYRRPSRRSSGVPDVILPSLRQPLPRVALVLDTSGSMGPELLGRALGEVGGVLRGLGMGRDTLRVLCCDAQAYQAQKVLDARAVRLLGGGGTDMGAGLHAATELRPRPDLVIVLTDGHTPWPSRPPPRVRVVVGLLDHMGQAPDWAVTVRVDVQGLTA